MEEAADRAAELTRQFQLEAWCHVLSPADAAKLYAGDPAALEAAGDAVGLPLSSILLLSAEPRAVAAARASASSLLVTYPTSRTASSRISPRSGGVLMWMSRLL